MSVRKLGHAVFGLRFMQTTAIRLRVSGFGSLMALGALVAAGGVHCGDNASNPAQLPDAAPDTYLPPPDADAGADAPPVIPPPPPPPPGCKEAAKGPHPADDACWISPAFGVFVSSSKAAANPGITPTGKQDAPFVNLSAALAAIKANPSPDRTRIFMCAENYSEPTLELADGINVYGYFDCKNNDAAGRWKVAAATSATINSLNKTGMRATSIAKPTRIEAIKIAAAYASLPGESSYGLIARDSSGLTFVGSQISAGKGGDGTDGVEGVQLSNGASINGNVAIDSYYCYYEDRPGFEGWYCGQGDEPSNVSGGVNNCVALGGAQSGISGGPGGNGGSAAMYKWTKSANPIPGGRPFCPTVFLAQNTACFIAEGPWVAAEGSGFVETPATAKGAASSFRAQTGKVGMDGSSGQNALAGLLGIIGYQAALASSGVGGKPGQGGGGGSGTNRPAELPLQESYYGFRHSGTSGAGGGAGGCPGLAGTPGTSGGASIGVLASNSKITFDKTNIVAARGGVAGKGSVGSTATIGGSGQPAGTGGPGAVLSASANGGAGGKAGISGHGAPGPSYGIAWTGVKPVIVVGSPEPMVGTPAAGQPQLTNADGNVVPAMPAGAAETIYAF
jgi:hypothetical protein